MKVIEYQYVCGEKTLQVWLSYNQENLELAKKESADGTYTIKEVPGDGIY